MSKLWVAFGIAASAIVGLTAWAVVRSKTPDLGPAGPNRDLAPETLAVYAEFPDVAGIWRQMEKTEAWQDFAASKIAERLLASQRTKDFLEAIEQVSQKASYPVNARNALKFVGRELSVGIAMDPAGASPDVLVLTKLDVEALSQDFLGGNVNLDALWGELQRRTGKCDFTVTASDYRGHTIALAARDGAEYHAALVGDTLAVSTADALVRATIDCRLSHGERSIGRKAAFADDVKALPPGTTAFEWFDLDALDSGRNSLDSGLRDLGAPPETRAAVNAVLDGTKGAHSVALAESLPGGDLYKSTWTFSKSADLFADRASAPVRSFFAGDWIFYGEFREIGGVATAFERSALKKKLGASEIGKWLDGVMNDPGPTLGSGLALLAGPRRGRAGRDPSGGRAGALDEDLQLVDQFLMKMGRHVVTEEIHALANGEAGFAVDWGGKGEEDVRASGALRLDTQGRLAALALEGWLLEVRKGEVAYEQVGQRRLFSATADGTKVWWVLVGDALLLTNDREQALAAARTGQGPAPEPSKALADAIASLKAGWRAFGHLDWERLRRAIAKSTEQPGAVTAQFAHLLDIYEDVGIVGSGIAFATYIPDDFGSIEMRSTMRLSPPHSDAAKAIRAEQVDREPLVWKSLPDTTFVSLVNYPGTLGTLWTLVKQIAGREMDDAANAFRESMQMDLEKDLMAAIGPELSFTVTFRAPPPPSPDRPGPGPFMPGLLLGIEVRNEAVVRKALDRAMQLADEASREGRGSGETMFSRLAHGGAEYVRIEIPEEESPIPLHPAFALRGGYFLVSSETDVLLASLDAGDGKGKRFADSPVFQRATAAVGTKCTTAELVDWGRLVDQVAEYAPQMGGVFAGADVPYPEPPADGNEAEWERRQEEYRAKMMEARAGGGAKAKAWIESFRVIDFIGATVRTTGEMMESVVVVKFAE